MSRRSSSNAASPAAPIALLLVASCTATTSTARFDEARLRRHIQILSSDPFEGRAPGTAGEEKTVAYLAGEFQALGLEPANGASYFQEVPLVEVTAQAGMELLVEGGADPARRLAYGADFIAWTKRVVPGVELQSSPLVFVGYGVVAPEYGWDDYADLDVRGKTVVMLVNDPGHASVGSPGSEGSELFGGRAMTYYGRWTYKFEEASRRGAAGALIIHDTEGAGYGWDVVTGSWSGAQNDLVSDDGNASRCAIEGWITQEAAGLLFGTHWTSFEDLRARADQSGFRGFALDGRASIAIHNEIRRSSSKNVCALLRGSARPEEVVLYMAHWDHLGIDPALEQDPIYNGAVDNASGTTALLELARAFASLPERPARSLLFIAVTAEESGLLGSRWYAAHPLVPPGMTVGGINIDGLDTTGRKRDIAIVGYGKSELEPLLAQAAAAQDRATKPEGSPERGAFYRSDHFSLAKLGVPMLYTDPGRDSREHGEAWGKEREEEYLELRYHKPADEYDPAWDLAGALEDLELFFEVGQHLACSDQWPQWNRGTEFRAAREASRPSAGGP